MNLKICLKVYKKVISPLIHCFNPNSGCRFYPTCSEYSYQAIKKYGLVKGLIKSFKRIIKCNPFNKGGYNPC
jgi:putative membrane protein insertion efficiency factor